MSSRLTTASGVGLQTGRVSDNLQGKPFLPRASLKKLTKDPQTAGETGARNSLVTQVHK